MDFERGETGSEFVEDGEETRFEDVEIRGRRGIVEGESGGSDVGGRTEKREERGGGGDVNSDSEVG